MARHITNRFDFDNVISGFYKIVESGDLYQKYHKMLEPELFFYNDISPQSIQLRQLIKWLHSMMKTKQTKNPSLTAFRDYIHSYPLDTEQDKLAKDLFDSTYSRPDIQNRMKDEGCFDLFVQYLKIIRFIKYSTKMFSEYQSGNVDEAADLMKTTLEEISLLNKEEHDILRAKEDIDKIIFQKDNERKQVLYTGCGPLDSSLGGFEPCTLSIFMSVTNGGKSMMAHHLIKRAIQQQMYVHITCVEDRKISFTRKLVACLTGIPINVLKEYNKGREPTSEEKELIKQAITVIDQFVRVDFIYGASIGAIHKIKKEYDLDCLAKGKTRPLVDIIDYTGHISGKSRGDKMFEQMRNAYGERKDFALSTGKICFDFAQVNREGSKKLEEKALTSHDLAGSYDLAQVCDNIISINRSPVQIDAKTAVLKVAKARDGEVGHEFEVKTNFASAQFLMGDEDTRWLTGRANDVARLMRVP